MFRRAMRHLRPWQVVLVSACGVLVVTTALILPRFVGNTGLIVIPLGLAAVIAAGALILVRVELLPAIALAAFALIPARLLPQEGLLGALPLTTIVLVVWGIRRLLGLRAAGSPPPLGSASGRSPGNRKQAAPATNAPFLAVAVVAGALFLLWCIFALVRSSDVQASTGWLISFTAGALLPLAIRDSRAEARWVLRFWLVLSGTLGAYAVLEAALGRNLVWGTLYGMLGVTDSQHWSVYRAEASFGHPLFAALFLAVGASLAVGHWLTTKSRATFAAAVFSAAGLAATVSRGAMLAAAVAVTVAIAAAFVVSGEKRWTRFLLLGVLAVAGIVGLFQFDAFTARSDSFEAQLSSQARDTGAWVAMKAAEFTGWIGSGPGTSGATGRLFHDVTIENSLLQLLISVGLPGLLLFVVLVGCAFLHALGRRAIGAAAALLAYAIAIAGFNALDALRPMHLLLGCLLLLTLNAGGGPAPAAAPAGRIRASRVGRAHRSPAGRRPERGIRDGASLAAGRRS